VSDRDPRFTGRFMKTLLGILCTKQRLSTAFHPQTNGQTERMNRTLEGMLRHYVGPHHQDWDNHLAMAEFAMNNAYQESIKTTPFRLVFNKDPPTPLSMGRTESSVPAATDFANQMQQSLVNAEKCLDAACQHQKRYADEHRRPQSFKIGDEVLLSSKNVRLLTKSTPKLLSALGPSQWWTIGEDAMRTLRTPQMWWPTSWLCQTTCRCIMCSMSHYLSNTGTAGCARLCHLQSWTGKNGTWWMQS